MSMPLDRRLQVLLDEDQYRRLEEHAARRGESVAALVREAIDERFPNDRLDRRRAGELLMEARPMAVDDWTVMKEELLGAVCEEPDGA